MRSCFIVKIMVSVDLLEMLTFWIFLMIVSRVLLYIQTRVANKNAGH